jgi:hypothetical protein
MDREINSSNNKSEGQVVPVCLVCGKKMSFLYPDHDQVNDGGNVTLAFHYGSKHDQMIGINDRSKPANGYICDECFEKVMTRTDYCEPY